jgi:hypothetical protein
MQPPQAGASHQSRNNQTDKLRPVDVRVCSSSSNERRSRVRKQYFFSTTREGFVRVGSIEDDCLISTSQTICLHPRRAAFAYEPVSRLLAAPGDNIHPFEAQRNQPHNA